MPDELAQVLASRRGWRVLDGHAEYRPGRGGLWGRVSRAEVGGRWRWHASLIDGEVARRALPAWSVAEAAEWLEQQAGSPK